MGEWPGDLGGPGAGLALASDGLELVPPPGCLGLARGRSSKRGRGQISPRVLYFSGFCRKATCCL